MVRVLFVCLGNICRSPLAAGVMRRLVAESALADEVQVESAAIGPWHVGEAPDARAVATGAVRGYVIDGVARQMRPRDFRTFDLVVGMDRRNVDDLLRLAPADEVDKVRQLVDIEVPDPYYGDQADFDAALDIIETGCRALLEELRESVSA